LRVDFNQKSADVAGYKDGQQTATSFWRPRLTALDSALVQIYAIKTSASLSSKDKTVASSKRLAGPASVTLLVAGGAFGTASPRIS